MNTRTNHGALVPIELTPELAAKGYEQYGFGPGITVLEQPKPFTLPTPPPGMRWHREDWTAEMLPPGTRPLVGGEQCHEGDEEFHRLRRWEKCDEFVMKASRDWIHTRTTRPLLFTHEGHEWTWHRAGDPMPCDGERMVLGMTLHGGAQKTPTAGKNYLWEVNDRNPLIGWRYADAEKPDPYAKYKQALQEGKTVQVLTMKGEWMDWRGDEDFSPRHPDNIRIKPDETPWTEWHGGECPLRDDEVEEWEYKCRDGFHCLSAASKPSKYLNEWRHLNVEGDIIAYRVLKTREPKPKVPLGPEDVTPGSAVKAKTRTHSWYLVTGVSAVDLILSNGSVIIYAVLQRDFLINRSISLNGKWDATKWEACEK